MVKSQTSHRAIQRERRMRRDPFGRLCLEINRYLKTVGWNAVIMGNPQVRGDATNRIGNYEFAVRFTGGKLKSGRQRPRPERSDHAFVR